MRCIVGLGNVGEEYAKTRHNAGFMVVDAIAAELGVDGWKKEKKYLYAKAGDVLLVKPTTFMNLSGEAVLAAMMKHSLAVSDFTVIHDDLDLAVGDVREKVGGGNAGHNGLKSIDAAIGKDYRRIRIGIGHPRELGLSIDVADYVLGRFPKSDVGAIGEAIEGIATRLVC